MPGNTCGCAKLWLVFFLVMLMSCVANSIPCPQRCLCFRTTVKCMSRQLRTIPSLPVQTTVVDLRFNSIKVVPANIFQDLKHVNTLLLNDNQINKVESGAFRELKELRYLYLYKNRIKTLDRTVFLGLSKLEHLRLDSNPLICDCRMMWLIHMFKDKKRAPHVSGTCQIPVNLRGKSISTVNESEFKCIAPTLTKTPNNAEAVPSGSSVELRCETFGDPPPIIVWRKDSSLVNNHSRYQIHVNGSLLFLRNIEKSDEGLYECKVENDVGYLSSFLHIRVKDNSWFPGDNFVRASFEEAKRLVDRAFSDDQRHILNATKNQSITIKKLSRFYFPNNPRALQLVRGAEIYEQTLMTIKRRVQSGAEFNASGFSYSDLLSPSAFETIANLSGCSVQADGCSCSDICFHSQYRSFDGTCNNLGHPTWGASETAFFRNLRSAYVDGFTTPIGWSDSASVNTEPSSKLVAEKIASSEDIFGSNLKFSQMLIQWSKFLNHDLQLAPQTGSVKGFIKRKNCSMSRGHLPTSRSIDNSSIDDPQSMTGTEKFVDFVRSSPICGPVSSNRKFFDVLLPREQMNAVTSYIDASQIYGNNEKEAGILRDIPNSNGQLREGILAVEGDGKPFLPFGDKSVDCPKNAADSECKIGRFLSGDIRVNDDLGVTAMYILWFREHNRVANALLLLNDHWDEDKLFHEARKIVGAQMQHITYEHWLPKVLGPKGMEKLGPYKGYNPNVDATTSNSFAAVAMRFDQTFISPVLRRLNSRFKPITRGYVPLNESFLPPFRIVEEGGIDPLLRGFFATPAKFKKSDRFSNEEEINRQAREIASALAANNIQRGRDHGLPGYNEWRKFCNLTDAKSFHDLKRDIGNKNLREKLQGLYGHPSKVDVWVGAIAEDPVEGALVGPTFSCLLIDQFQRLREGDRFFYQNPGIFKPEQLNELQQSSLSRILCDNGDNIEEVSSDVFTIPQQQHPLLLSCSTISHVDLRFWVDCCDDCTKSDVSNTKSQSPPRHRLRRDLRGTYVQNKITSSSTNKWMSSSQQMNGQSTNLIEDLVERVTGVEKFIRQIQKQLKQLRKKFRQLELECQNNGRSKQCRDSKGIARDHGEKWDVDSCKRCRCEDQQITCEVKTCPTLNCKLPVLHENECCPAC